MKLATYFCFLLFNTACFSMDHAETASSTPLDLPQKRHVLSPAPKPKTRVTHVNKVRIKDLTYKTLSCDALEQGSLFLTREGDKVRVRDLHLDYDGKTYRLEQTIENICTEFGYPTHKDPTIYVLPLVDREICFKNAVIKSKALCTHRTCKDIIIRACQVELFNTFIQPILGGAVVVSYLNCSNNDISVLKFTPIIPDRPIYFHGGIDFVNQDFYEDNWRENRGLTVVNANLTIEFYDKELSRIKAAEIG